MFIPEGLTEDEVINIMYRAARRHARKYCFGYHSIEDIVQEAVIFLISTLDKGKFKPRGIKPIAQQLYNFCSIWARNRQSNYRRDHSCRYSNPTSKLNVSKYNIMHPLKIHSQGLTQSNMFARESNLMELLDCAEIKKKILDGLTIQQRKTYFKLLNGDTVPAAYEKDLFDQVAILLGIKMEDNAEENMDDNLPAQNGAAQ